MSQAFTRNSRDHSNDSGFQFEFNCDRCGNGFRSTFQTSTLGVAAGLLKAAGSFFGGRLHQVGYGADQVKDALRGPAWDSAFKDAVTELRPKFKQCTACGAWVCPEVCWNHSRDLCEGCAPNLQEQAGSIQAKVAVEQAWDKARAGDQTGGVDLRTTQRASSTACAKCQTPLLPAAKFCTGCGTPVAKATFCAGCGEAVGPGMKFCGGCGAAQP